MLQIYIYETHLRADCLEELLAPLTSVTELATHPTLSRPFTSNALTELANQGCDLMHKENSALSKVRPLLTRLSGDHTWANCEMFLGPDDHELFDEMYMSRMLKRRKIDSSTGDEDETAATKLNGSSATQAIVNGEPSWATNGVGPGHQQQKMTDEDVAMTDGFTKVAEKTTEERREKAGNFSTAESPSLVHNESELVERQGPTATNGNKSDDESKRVNGDPEYLNKSKEKGKEPETRPDPREDDVDMLDSGAGVEAKIATEPSSHLQPNENEAASLLAALRDESFIHPIFLAPKAAHPDRDLGLPEQEAEDVRRLLQLYAQKQEEVCRGARKLYEGLLKADRLRKTVLAWSKAEAHCGPNRDMSDGEDWYDQEEWGLTEDLKKGQDEEEEDTTQTQKKTRNRNK